MWALVLRIMAYFFGIVGGLTLVTGVILRIAKGPQGSIFFEIQPNAYLGFSQVCLLFAIALGVAAILGRREEREKKKEKKGK